MIRLDSFKVSFEELLAWLRQPRCSGLSGFQWNTVIPASTESQIDRGSDLDSKDLEWISFHYLRKFR